MLFWHIILIMYVCVSVELKAEGKARSIGVSNYGIHHIQELLTLPAVSVKPAVNQIEISPYLPRDELVSFCQNHNIVTEAYSPLTKAARLKDPKLLAISAKYSVTPAQLLIQWCLQRHLITIPTSANPSRISENSDALTVFAGKPISASDLEEMRSWDEGLVTGWDPTTGP